MKCPSLQNTCKPVKQSLKTENNSEIANNLSVIKCFSFMISRLLIINGIHLFIFLLLCFNL